MAWELMNEPGFKTESLRRDWTAEMSAYVRSLDPKHLIGTGASNSRSPDELRKDLRIATVDYGTWHAYPVHDKTTPQQLQAAIPRYCRTAADLGKPLLLEEFGYARSNLDQAASYEQWLQTLTDDRNCAGWMVWELVARQQNGHFPRDEHDQFNIADDGSPLWDLLKKQYARGASFAATAGSYARARIAQPKQRHNLRIWEP